MKRPCAVLLLAMFAIVPAMQACPTCYGDPSAPMTKGANNGIMFLLGIVFFVQVGFVALFWSFWRRAKELRKRRDQFHLLTGGLR
jgi:hypothetical protein